MNRRPLAAVAVGIAVLWLTQWGKPHLMGSLRMMDVFIPIVQLLPGFCAGIIAGRRGILLGALTGFIGGATYSTFLFIFRAHVPAMDRFFSSLGAPLWFQFFSFGLIITCAAGGAVGELLHSNNRWRGP